MENELQVSQFVQSILDNDVFSQWLGMQLVTTRAGYCRLQMQVREDMLNGIGVLHGGVLFSLADSCFGFASNSHGRKAVSLQASINFLGTARPGEMLFAEAEELHYGKSTGVYEIRITHATGRLLAVYKGTCFIKGPQQPGS